jgi:hypothetical protein
MNGNDWSWLSRWCRGRDAKRPASARRPAARFRRLGLEELECRRLLNATNLFGSAVPLALTIGRPQAGVISQTPSYYAFSVTDAGRLTAEVAATGGATRLTLLSSGGQILMQSDGQSAGNPNDLMDLHLTGSPSGTNYYLEVQELGTGTGSFVLMTDYQTTSAPGRPLPTGGRPFSIATGDFAHNGNVDFAVTSLDSGGVTVYLTASDGTLEPQRTYADYPGAYGIIAGDFTGRGNLDLAYANLFTGTISILAGNGDGTFRPAGQTWVTAFPVALVAGDFTGNHRLDLAVTSDSNGTVSILLNNGDGTFGTPRVYQVGTLPTAIVAGDFNGDGKLDLVTANAADNDLSILIGNGDGTFTPGTTVSVGTSPDALVAGDFNGDGKLDLATANFGSNDISVLLGNGNGTFAPETLLTVGTQPSALAVADFNGDRHMDLAAVNYDGTMSIFLGRGNGQFGPKDQSAVGSSPIALAVADFNHDGTPDLAMVDQTTATVQIISGRGDGTFQTPPLKSPNNNPTQVASGVFTTHGRLDLAVLDGTTSDVTILSNNGDGTFRFAGKYSVGAYSQAIQVADLRGNGIADIITTSAVDGIISVLLGRGDGTFAPAESFATGSLPVGLVVGDFNGDTKLDMAVADEGSNQVSILFGDGAGHFAPRIDYAAGIGPGGIAAGDFDNDTDGHLDLAVINGSTNTISVLLNNGDGTFAPPFQLNTDNHPSGIVTGDLTGNGHIDLAVANSGDGTLSVFLGDGLGGFAGPIILPSEPGVLNLLVGDFNGDGRLELAAIGGATKVMTVYRWDGQGGFQQTKRLPAGSQQVFGVVGDFNGDGKVDIVTANGKSSDVSLFLGDGRGSFQTALSTAVSSGPIASASADFTNDGNLDLVTANPTSGNVQVSLANGDGTFQTPVTVAHGGEPVAVTTGDFNRDGRQDIAVAHSQTDTVSILLGIGDGTFEPPLVLSVGSRPDALVTGAFNGDGLLDLAVANFGSGTVSVFVGRADGSFATAQRIAVGAGPVALAVGDVNNDGKLELIVGNSRSRSLSILEGAGDGTFGLVSTVALGVVPTSVVTDDFNGDGKVDIAVASQGSNIVSVFFGIGDGTFRAAVPFATGTGPVSLVTGDFNGDGHRDLATANTNSNDVTVLLGRGDGTFQAQTPFGVGAYPSALVVGDFNNDGRLDLATANGLGVPLSIGLGLGNGTFLAPGASFPPIQSPPLVADFNGDGILDVVSLRADGKILFRAGQGGGLFLPPVVINPAATSAARSITLGNGLGRAFVDATDARDGSLSFYTAIGGHFLRIANGQTTGLVPAHILVGDANGDGLQDVVLNYAETGQIVVYLQHPSENFSGRAELDYQMRVEGGVSDIILADMNGDGRLDIVATDQSSGEVHVFLNSAVNPFSTELSFRAGTDLVGLSELDGTSQVQSSGTPLAVVAGQFNKLVADRATIPDLAVLNSGANRVDILVGDGHGGVYNPAPATSLHTGLDPVAIVTANFNPGGLPDLAVLNKGSNDLSIFLGDGYGGFTEKVLLGPDGQKIRIGAGNAPTGLTVVDINRDGNLDLLVGDAQGDVLTLLGNGDGTFRPYQRIDRHVGLAVSDLADAGGPDFAFADQSLDRVTFQAEQSTTFQQGRQNGVVAPNSLQFADLNGDGIPDLIVTNSGGNNILVYLGLGNDRFGTAHRFFTGTDPAGVTVGDLNGDGIPDLVVANEGSNDLSIWFGQGRGADWTMTPGPRLDAGVGPVATVIRDVSGDAFPDILVANGGSNNVYQLNGVGRGFFDDQHPVIFQTGSDPVQLFVGHFDNQPGLDLITVNAGSNDLTLFAGFGPGHSLSLGGVDPVAAIAGDFNRDGTSDLIVAHRDGTFALLLGDLGGPQVASLLELPGLTNISDLAFGQVTETGVDFYATVDGRAEAIPLAFVIEGNLSTGETIHGPTSAQVVNRQVTEFTSVAGSAELEVIATLTLGFDDPTTIPTSHTIPGGRIIPAVWETLDTGRIEAAVAEEMIARADGPEEFERNASISGAAETPLQEFLKNSKRPAIRVPFSSPLEVFDGSGSIPLDPDEYELASAGDRPDPVVGARVTRPVSVAAERIHPPDADSLDRPSSPPTLRAPIGQPIAGDAAPAADELEDRSGSWLLGLRRLASLALSLLGGSFVRERHPLRSETPRHQRSNR